MHVNITGAEDFQREVLGSELPIIFMLWSSVDKNGLCDIVAEKIDRLLLNHVGYISHVRVNLAVDENRELRDILRRQYGAQIIPTLLYFDHGELVGQDAGLVEDKILIERVKAFLPQTV